MSHPFLKRLTAPMPIAHRGGAGLFPENTLFAFEQAVARHGAKMIELDLQRSRDGELIVFHDDTLERCTDGQGRVADHDLAQLLALDAGFRFSQDGRTFPFRGRGIGLCTLDTLLSSKALAGVPLNIELKCDLPQVERQLADALRRHDALDRVCIGSELDALAARIAEATPSACHFFPREALTAFVMAAYSGEPWPLDERWQVLDAPLEHEGFRVVQPPLIEAVRRHGRWLNVWTVDREEDMRALVELGVGGIMTDRPDLLCRILQKT
jgi:glycerophosphoryl diester phosphodiesterase